MSFAVSCSLDPRNDRPRGCKHCESAEAVEGRLCAECAVKSSVDDYEYEAAHEIAERHDLSREYVERTILEAEAYARTVRREMHDAMVAA